MGLFDQIRNALDNPTQQANPQQLSQILGTIQQLSQNQGMNSATTQTLTSIVGQYIRHSLREKQNNVGESGTEEIINQYSGVQANSDAVHALFTPQQQQEMTTVAAQKTGLDFSKIQAMLPVLVPIVLNLLQSGSSQTRGQNPQQNSVLNTFLDSDNDGDVDVADALSLASRFLR